MNQLTGQRQRARSMLHLQRHSRIAFALRPAHWRLHASTQTCLRRSHDLLFDSHGAQPKGPSPWSNCGQATALQVNALFT
jgi:hypothetical protein